MDVDFTAAIEWAPGGPPLRSLRLAEVLEAVAARPGQWAVVGRYRSVNSARTVASRLRKGHIGPPVRWELAVCPDAGGTAALYVRRLPDHYDPNEEP